MGSISRSPVVCAFSIVSLAWLCSGVAPCLAQTPLEFSLIPYQQWSSKYEDQQPLRNPLGICLDPEGLVYVADTGNNRVVVFSTDGRWLREVGGLGSGANQFNRPSDVTIKLGLELLVADAGNDRIERFNRRLGFIGTIRNDDAFTEPISLDVSTSGDYFLLDGTRRQAVKIEVLTGQVVPFGGIDSGAGQLEDPNDIRVRDEESVWVADGVSGDVVQFDLFGNYLTRFHLGDGVDVQGLAVGDDGVWVAAGDRVGYLKNRGTITWYLDQDDLKNLAISSATGIAVSNDLMVVLDGAGGKLAWFQIQSLKAR
jgi:hypothetical protein